MEPKNYNATITCMMGYEIYMLAIEHLAKMIEYPAYDDWRNVEYELHRAKHVKKYMEDKFPEFVEDKEIQEHCNYLLERAERFYTKRCEMERETLHRRLEYGKTTLEAVKGE